MNNYVIFTDSAADLGIDMVKELDVQVIPLTAIIDGKEYLNYPDEREITNKKFFEILRSGVVCKTSAVNTETFVEAFEPYLNDGKDILYLGFSSGLSCTCESGQTAAAQLAEKYPERKIYAVDTLCASLGQGLLVYLCCKEKNAGKSIEEVRDYAENNKMSLSHWFTVDDLNHLKRGGRLSAATALLGTMLHIKPVLHVDNDGHLINMEKARGRKASIRRLAEKVKETALPGIEEQQIFICHGDCIDEAKQVGDEIKKLIKLKKEIYYNSIGPVIGAHAGAGTIAVFFLAKER